MYGEKILGRTARHVRHRPEGIVAHVIPKVPPKKHDEEVLAALAELTAA